MYLKSTHECRLHHCRFILCVLLLTLCSPCNQSEAQEANIEDRIPSRLAARDDVWPIIQKLRLLRSNEARFGELHPRMAAIKEQIASLEMQLAALNDPLKEKAANSPDIKGTAKDDIANRAATPVPPPSDQPRSAENLAAQNVERTFPVFHEIMHSIDRRNWNPEYSPSFSLDGLPFELNPAFKNLKFDGLTAVGTFPAMAIMWGIENDDQFQVARVWQWHDDEDYVEKSILMELKGTICDFVLDPNFETTGFVYLCVASGEQDKQQNSDCILMRYQLATLPPFNAPSYAPDILLRARGVKSEWTISKMENSEVMEIQGIRSSPEVIKESIAVEEQADNVFAIHLYGLPEKTITVIPRPGTKEVINSPQMERGRIAGVASNQQNYVREKRNRTISYEGVHIEEATGGRISIRNNHEVVSGTTPTSSEVVLTRTTNRLLGIALRSNGEPVLYTNKSLWTLHRRKTKTDRNVFPKLLSETGWFTSLQNQEVSQGFISYQPMSPTLTEGIIGKNWIRIPNDKTLEVRGPACIHYPDGTMFLQSLSSLDSFQSREPIHRETRGLIKLENDWEMFAYRWLADQSDAELVDLDNVSQLKTTESTWKYPSRSECILCHDRFPSAKVLGFSLQVLNDRIETPVGSASRYDLWKRIALIERSTAYTPTTKPTKDFRFQLARVNVPSKLSELNIDWAWFKESAVKDNLEFWLRSSPTPSGFFQVNLDQNWTPTDPREGTVVSQSRLIYVMSEGFRITGDPKFLVAATRGADYLLEELHDPVHGGYWWSITSEGKVLERTKSSYGHAFAVFALSHVFSVSKTKKYEEAALNSWRELIENMSDNHGGFYEKANEEFKEKRGNSQNPIMHIFEAAIALWDATGSRQVLNDADAIASFVCDKLWRQPGLIPEAFDEPWTKAAGTNGELWIESGHQAEWAFLFSEGVRCGLSRRYLGYGNKLIDFTIQSCYDSKAGGLGEYRAIDRKGAWQQAEFLRALLRYYADHGREDLRLPIQLTVQHVRNNFSDSVSGGWPVYGSKHRGSIWHCGSHEILMYSEGIRLAAKVEN